MHWSTTACTATIPYRPGQPCAVIFQDYKTGLLLALRNETHTPKEILYSTTSHSSSTKIISDELMEYLLQEFAAEDFFVDATAISLPEQGKNDWLFGLSCAIENTNYTQICMHATEAAKTQRLLTVMQEFRKIYDGTFQAQSVKESAKELFQKAQKELKNKNKNQDQQP